MKQTQGDKPKEEEKCCVEVIHGSCKRIYLRSVNLQLTLKEKLYIGIVGKDDNDKLRISLVGSKGILYFL
jgi:hypothetical protein